LQRISGQTNTLDSDNILLKKYDKNGNEEGPVENLMTNSKEAISKEDF
jgi:hypothetical protein